MSNLRLVNIEKLSNTLDTVLDDFKKLKKTLKNEILKNNGRISIDRLEEYEDLFLYLKNSNIFLKAFQENKDLINLDGKELDIFCEKIKLDEKKLNKYKIGIERIDKFNINEYVETCKKEYRENKK